MNVFSRESSFYKYSIDINNSINNTKNYDTDYDELVMKIWNDIYINNSIIINGIKNHLYTFVSGYVYESDGKYRSDHSFDKFLKQTAYIYEFDIPLIMFEDKKLNISIKNKYHISIRQNKTKSSTIIIPINKYNLLFSDLILNDKTYYKIWTTPKLSCLIWMNKCAMLRYISIINPFNSKYFIWIDAGFFLNDAMFIRTTKVFNGSQQVFNILNDNKMLYADATFGKLRNENCKNYLTSNQLLINDSNKLFNKKLSGNYNKILSGSNLIGGSPFAGTRIAIKQFSNIYFKAFKLAYYKKFDHIPYDQGFYASIICIYPNIANLIWCNNSQFGQGVYQVWMYLGNRCNPTYIY